MGARPFLQRFGVQERKFHLVSKTKTIHARCSLGIKGEKRKIYQEIQGLVTSRAAQKIDPSVKKSRAQAGFEEGIGKADKEKRDKWRSKGGSAGWDSLTPEQRAERIEKKRERRWGKKNPQP